MIFIKSQAEMKEQFPQICPAPGAGRNAVGELAQEELPAWSRTLNENDVMKDRPDGGTGGRESLCRKRGLVRAEVRDPGKGSSEEAVSTWQLALTWLEGRVLPIAIAKDRKINNLHIYRPASPQLPGFWDNSSTDSWGDSYLPFPGCQAGFYGSRLQKSILNLPETHAHG